MGGLLLLGLAAAALAAPAAQPAGAPGLVAAYAFDETSGASAIDSSGSGNTGTISGASSTAAGKFGRALSFDGADDLVSIADSGSLDLTTAMTLEAWVNPATIANWRTILMKEAKPGLAYSLYASDGSKPGTFVRVGGADAGRVAPASLALNTWTHVAATYDGTALRVYINGTLVSSGNVAGGPMLTSTGVLRIGGNSIWGEYFSGLIDEVRVYGRVLSAAEIVTDMNTAIKP